MPEAGVEMLERVEAIRRPGALERVEAIRRPGALERVEAIRRPGALVEGGVARVRITIRSRSLAVEAVRRRGRDSRGLRMPVRAVRKRAIAEQQKPRRGKEKGRADQWKIK